MLVPLFLMCAKLLLSVRVFGFVGGFFLFCFCFNNFSAKEILFLHLLFVTAGLCKGVQSKELTQSYHKTADSSLSILEHFHVSMLLHNHIHLSKIHMNKRFPCLQSLPSTVTVQITSEFIAS